MCAAHVEPLVHVVYCHAPVSERCRCSRAVSLVAMSQAVVRVAVVVRFAVVVRWERVLLATEPRSTKVS